MAYEQRDNSGVLFQNDRKTNANSPDMNGTIMVAGVMYWINGWKKQGSKGNFLSLSVQPKDGGQQQAPRQQQRPAQSPPPIFRNPTPKPTTPPEQYPEHKMRDKTYKPVAEPKPDDTFDPDDIPF